MINFSVDNAEFLAEVAMYQKNMGRRAKNVVRLTAGEAANFAKSKTSNTKPGVLPGQGPRYTHPGGWADVTSNLAASIRAGKVTISGSEVTGEFGVITSIDGSMEYADELDKRKGYSVLADSGRVAKKSLYKNMKEILK